MKTILYLRLPNNTDCDWDEKFSKAFVINKESSNGTYLLAPCGSKDKDVRITAPKFEREYFKTINTVHVDSPIPR